MKALLTLFLIVFYQPAEAAKATFAGGCFWCMESPFEKLDGVNSVVSGYAGGTKKNPSYKEVASGSTRHVEAVQIDYDPKVVSYRKLLEVFWQQIDPTDGKELEPNRPPGQFVDKGFQYTSAIFFHDDKEKELAEASRAKINNLKIFKNPVSTRIVKFTTFYPAEDYHQDYYKKNLITKTKYKYYRSRSGRDQFIDRFWKNSGFSLTKPVKNK